MTDRLRCINPLCYRTAPKPNFPYATEIVCVKCWKTVPEHLKAVYRGLRKTRRRYEKVELTRTLPVWYWEDLAIKQATNWSRIRDALQVKPEAPAGLGGFLKEIGFER